MSAHRQNFKPAPASSLAQQALNIGVTVALGIAIAAIALQWCLADTIRSVG